MDWTPPEIEGPLTASWAHTGKQLVRRLEQPTRNEILAQNYEDRKDDDSHKDLSFGRKIGSIPLLDYYQLQKTHPHIFAPGAKPSNTELAAFWTSDVAKPYRLGKY